MDIQKILIFRELAEFIDRIYCDGFGDQMDVYCISAIPCMINDVLWGNLSEEVFSD